jgi:cytidine deaminase
MPKLSEWIQNQRGGVEMSADIDWKILRDNAIAACTNAYAPYSNFPVGAAALVDDHRLVSGCNVENVSYGLGLCAECAVVCVLHSTGGGRLLALVCVAGDGELLMPCGRCRQVLLEHGGPDMLIDAPGGARRLAELLPAAFGPDDLDRARCGGQSQ